MYKGFDLTIDTTDFSRYYNTGLSLYESTSIEAKRSLESFLLPGGNIDASELKDYWFPLIKADVFVSHYHTDEKLAIAFAGWLKLKFGLNSFIDSCIWRHCNDLLWEIDNKLNSRVTESTFNYQERNYSTSHVHMMLQAALTQMIDHCECLFFINKPSSMDAENVIKKTTNSPWIYSEIMTAKYIEKKFPERLKRPLNKFFSKSGERSIMEAEQTRFEYTMELSHLSELNYADMIIWDDTYNALPSNGLDALATLYKLNAPTQLVW